jgi:hypothetical protein
LLRNITPVPVIDSFAIKNGDSGKSTYGSTMIGRQIMLPELSSIRSATVSTSPFHMAGLEPPPEGYQA